MDPLDTETSRFWEDFGPQNPSDPASIQTEVFQLPTTCFAEENGSLVNSARWLQWHWKAADPPGEAQSRHLDHVRDLPPDARDVSQGRRRVPRSDPEPDLELHQPDRPEPGRTGEGHERPGAGGSQGRRPVRSRCRAGQLLDGFAQLRDDGTTASGCWIFSGCYTEKGNQMARRDATDPREQGIAPNWAWAWPANRRILYNRASADLDGKPGTRASRSSSGTAAGGSASTCPTMRRPPSRPTGSARSS